jgi:hypothetical protein
VDERGAYWVLSDVSFANGRVNFKIHKGGELAQGQGDRVWLVDGAREAWVNHGDPAVRTSLERADAAAAE